MLRADRHRVGNAVQEVKLLDADTVDLVEHIDNRDIAAALGLEDVDQVVDGSVAPNCDVRRADLVPVVTPSFSSCPSPESQDMGGKTPTRSSPP